jgi:PAS domain S-box-containing protein
VPVILFLTAVVNIAIACFVLLKNSHDWTNRFFAIVATAIAGWTIGICFATQAPTVLPLYITARFTFATAAIAIYALLLLFESITSKPFFPKSPLVALFGLLTGCFILLSFTDLVVTTVSSQWTHGDVHIIYGRLYPIYATFLFATVAASVRTNLSQLRSARGPLRSQSTYLALGLLCPGVLALGTNLVVPLVTRTSSLSQYGPLFSLLMIVIIAHAIVRHRLMGMRVVVTKGVVYAVSFSLSGVFLAGLIAFTHKLLGIAHLTVAHTIVLSLVVAVLFHPLKRAILYACDRYLYRGHYDFQCTIKSASAALTHMLKLPLLLEYVAEVTRRTMRSAWVAVYLKDSPSSPNYALVFQSPASTHRASPLPSTVSHQIALSCFPETRRPALGRSPDGRPGRLTTLGADLCVPLTDGRGLMGLIALGPKLSGDAYFTEDIDLLSTLANQAGVAIKNAQLYEQVVLINEYLENILGTIESAVIAVNRTGHITIFNRAAAQLTALRADAVLGRGIATLPGAFGEPLMATAEDGQRRVLAELELSKPNDSPLPVICLTSPLREPGGGLLGAVAVLSDLTPLKQLEAERRRAEQLAYFEVLAAGIGHEIKNPLVAVKTFTQLLPRKFLDEQFRQEFVRIVGREVRRMEHLAERLRSLARPGGGPHVPLELRAPIIDAVELVRPRLEEKRIATEWTLGGRSSQVFGDRAALEQLFLNLFVNALEAMEPGGTLSLRLQSADDRVTVEVEDTGPGIPEEFLSRIFEPFVTTKLHGSGLGLAICASIANAHHARIRAANKPGQRGAIFTIEFPAAVLAPTAAKA